MRRITVDIFWCSNVASFRLRSFVTKSCLVHFDAPRWFDLSDLSFLPRNPSTVSREILRRTKPPSQITRILSGPIESYCTRDGLTPPHHRFPPRTGRTSWPEDSPQKQTKSLKHTSQSGSCPEVKEISWNRAVHNEATNWVQHLPSICASQEDARCAEAKMCQQKIVKHSNQKLELSESISLAALHVLLMLESC